MIAAVRPKTWIPPGARHAGPPSRRFLMAAAVVLAASWTPRGAGAEPFTPASGEEVLEELPVDLYANRNEVARLRQKLAADPRNPEVAVAVAAHFVQLGGQSGDARFYGFAQAALAPWRDVAQAPTEVLRVQAKIHERNHDYDLALADLQRLLDRSPSDAQAWLDASNIWRVQGRYELAARACDKLASVADEFAASVGRIPLWAVTGRAREATALLERIAPLAEEQNPGMMRWIRTMQAEIALALGDEQAAEGRYREGLASFPGDKYLMRAYSDFLVERRRDAEALSLVAGQTNDDGLLLNAAIAARRLGRETEAARLAEQLTSRFAEIRQRGDEPLGRFEARFELQVNRNPQRALQLALANWRVQKETHDTQTALEAALAAGEPRQVDEVAAFVRRHKLEHAAIASLVAQLAPSPTTSP